MSPTKRSLNLTSDLRTARSLTRALSGFVSLQHKGALRIVNQDS